MNGRGGHPTAWCLAWAAFVAYDSLVPRDFRPNPLALAGLALSAGTGLWSPRALATASEASPLAALNSLHQAKGTLWAASVIARVQRLRRLWTDAFAPLARGMALGLVGTVAWMARKRLAFAGVLDFASDYRVSGPFSSMNVGGAHIECFLPLATPFLVCAFVRAPQAIIRRCSLALMAGSVYALMVTSSRAGDLVLALARPVAFGPYAVQRLKAVGRDPSTRQQRWADVATMADARSRLWAVRLGRFATEHCAQHLAARHTASFGRVLEAGVPPRLLLSSSGVAGLLRSPRGTAGSAGLKARSTTDYLQWHAKNLHLRLWIEQGAVGALAWAVSVAVAVWRAVAAARRGALQAWVAPGMFAVWLVLGAFGSVMDSLRTLMLTLLALALGLFPEPATTREPHLG